MNFDFKKILLPPILEDDEKSLQAYLLHMILWGLIFVPIPYVLYVSIAAPQIAMRALIQGAIAECINFILLYVLHRGYGSAASVIQVIAIWLFFTISALTEQGVHGEAYLLGYPLVIVITGVLLGGRATLVITFLSLLSGGLMTFAEKWGFMIPQGQGDFVTSWILSLAIFPMSAALQFLSTRALKNALQRARASEERYKHISRVSTDYIFEAGIDENGKNNLVWVAGAFKEMTGYTYEEYVASGGWATKVHPDDMEKDEQDMHDLMNNKDVKSEVRTFAKNGEVRWEKISAHPLWDDMNNRLVGIIGAVQDTTQQKITEGELRYERDLLQVFMDNIPDSVYFKDTESNFVRINLSQAKFLGVNDPQDAIGKTDLDFQDPTLAKQFMDEESQIVQSGESVINRLEFNPTKSGKPRWLSATKVPAKDSSGQVIGTIGISRDITAQKLVEEKLNQILIQQAAILNNIPDMAWLKDKDSRYIAVNDAFARNAGLERDQIVGKLDSELWPKHLAESYRENDLAVMQTRQVLILEEMQADSTGREFWIETFKTAILNAEGEVIGTTGISRDISERKQVEFIERNRREMLEKVIELGKHVTEAEDLKSTIKKIWHGIHDDLRFERLAIFLYNPERNSMDDTVGTNANGEMVENWEIWFPIGETFSEVLAKPDGLYFTHNYDLENNIKEGHEMYGVKDFAAVAAWAGDKPVAVLCADNALTQKTITNEQLDALRLYGGYAGMAIENARLNQAIKSELTQRKTFIKDLESKNAELEQFTYTVSHDLKSPLVTIEGFLGYIEKNALKGNFDQLRTDIGRIDQAVGKMQILLKNLLELSRVGRVINAPENIRFGEIVIEAIELLQGQIDARHIEIEYKDGGEIIHGDRVRLIEVMQNLLENSIKFTHDQPSPKITVGLTDHAQHGKVFFVRDNGIGIDPQYHERIFGLFNKLDSKSHGTGIGLALVKRIIEVHNGQIWIESKLGKGATFYFTLPMITI